MARWTYDNLRAFQGKVAHVWSTGGEAMTARVLLVDEEHGDLVLDVLATDQPERYERLGRHYRSAGWVMPFEFILEIRVTDEPSP